MASIRLAFVRYFVGNVIRTVPLGLLSKVEGNSDSSECAIFAKGSSLWVLISECPSAWPLPKGSYARKLWVEPGAAIGVALWFSQRIFIAVAVIANCLIVICTWSTPFLQNLGKQIEKFAAIHFYKPQGPHFGTRQKPNPQEGFPPAPAAGDLIIFGQTVPPKGNVINYPAKKSFFFGAFRAVAMTTVPPQAFALFPHQLLRPALVHPSLSDMRAQSTRDEKLMVLVIQLKTSFLA